jgi:hypothetical protein
MKIKRTKKRELPLEKYEENFVACLPIACWIGDREGNMVAFPTPEIAAGCPLHPEDGTEYYKQHAVAFYSKENDLTIIRTDLVERAMFAAGVRESLMEIFAA